MARFFLHLYNSIGYVPDEEGQDLRDLEDARGIAVDSIRDMIAAEARTGKIDLQGRIEIREEAGRVLDTVQFTEAVVVQTGGAP